MTVDINRVLQGGYDRTVARSGLLFAAVFYVLGLATELLSNDANPVTGSVAGGPAPGPPDGGLAGTGPSLGLSPTVAAALLLAVGLVSLVVTMAALRTFVADERERVPREFLTRNLALAVVNLFVGSIVFAVAVGVGFFLFVVPGLFLLVSLFFWEVVVVVDDEHLVEGFTRSWQLTSGNRLVLFLTGFVVVLAAFLVAVAFAVLGLFLPPTLDLLFEGIGGALINVFFLATVAETYTQLLEAERADASTDGDQRDDAEAGAA